MTQPEVGSAAGGELVVFTNARRPGRSPNEDASGVVRLDERRAVLLLADGMGGAAAGDHAASIAVSRIAERLHSIGEGDNWVRNAILDGIDESNQVIRELAVGAGTTIVAVEVSPESIRTYHAGDTLALLIGGQGTIRWRTPPHSPVGYAIEAGLLSEADAMTHPSRHLLANALGKRDLHVEIGAPQPLHPGDTLVVASDGLFDNLVLDEIATALRAPDLSLAVGEVVAAAAGRMESPSTSPLSKLDDLTVIAYRPPDPEGMGTLEFPPIEPAP